MFQKLKRERHKICCGTMAKAKSEAPPRKGHEGPEGE